MQCLSGRVTGHPHLPDGKDISTSPIVGKVGELVQTKSGNRYELGEIDPVYEAKYPNAKARFFATLPPAPNDKAHLRVGEGKL